MNTSNLPPDSVPMLDALGFQGERTFDALEQFLFEKFRAYYKVFGFSNIGFDAYLYVNDIYMGGTSMQRMPYLARHEAILNITAHFYEKLKS